MFIIGHRGARAVQPENTITALKEGMKCADFVEIDIHLTKDGVPVVLHDATLDRTTDGSGPVGGMTLCELREFNAGDGHPIPTLQEVCDLCFPSCGVVTEIKERGSEEAVCAILENHDAASLWVVSFHKESIMKVKGLLPRVKTGIICSIDCSDPFSPVREAGADAIVPRSDTVSSEMVCEAHRQGLSVIIWTLNTPAAYLRAWESGADGWVTDEPCGLRLWLEQSQK